MTKFDAAHKEIWKKAEWVALATCGPDGPHIVGAWGGHLRKLTPELAETIVIPAGGLKTTEENLKANPRIELLIATREVESSRGHPGQGCSFTGTAEIETDGPHADAVKAAFPWARGALVVRIETAALHL